MNLKKNRYGYYELRFTGPDGRERKMTTKKKSLEEAKKVVDQAGVAEIEQAARIGVLSQQVISVLLTGKRLTIEFVLQEWIKAHRIRSYAQSTIQSSTVWINHLIKTRNLQSKPIGCVTEEDICEWVNKPSQTVFRTRELMLSKAKNFFEFARDKGWIAGNPASQVRVDMSKLLHSQKESRPREAFEDREIYQLLDAVNPNNPDSNPGIRSAFWYAAIAIGRWTGLRLVDIACLEWACFQIPGRIAVWTVKKDKRIELPLEPEDLKAACDSIPKEHETYCFPQARVQYLWRSAVLSTQFSKILWTVGFIGKSFHCLRHTYIRDCYKRGVPIPHISQRVGHSHPETTVGYLGNSAPPPSFTVLEPEEPEDSQAAG